MDKELLSISRAARKMGMKRSFLQKKIQGGEITSFEGKVDIAELKQKCSSARNLDKSPMIEKTTFIKNNAYANRIQSAHLPDAHTLYSQVNKLRLKLKMQKQTSNNYLRTINALKAELQNIELNHDVPAQSLVKNLLYILNQDH